MDILGSEVDGLKFRDEEKDRNISALNIKGEDHQRDIAGLKSRVALLAQSFEGYLAPCRRFHDNYKIDMCASSLILSTNDCPLLVKSTKLGVHRGGESSVDLFFHQ